MKICATCQTKYSDSLEYCLRDGTVLATLADPNATWRLDRTPRQTSPAKTNRATVLAVIAFAALLLIVVVVAVIGMVAYRVSRVTASPQSRATNSSSSGTDQPQQINVATPEEDIPALIQRLNEEIGVALTRADFVTLDRLIAPDYLYENDRGLKLTKLQIMTFMRTGNLRYDYVNSSESSVTVSDDLTGATLAALAQSRGQFMRQPFNDNYRYRNTYEKRAGGWQLVSGYAWYR